jgi:hypothetical protein
MGAGRLERYPFGPKCSRLGILGNEFMKSLVGVALTVLLAGCAGSTGGGSSAANVAGNEAGGKLPYAEGQMPAAMSAAQAHCGKFGKKAQIIKMTPGAQGGGEIGFDCR